MSFSQTVEDIRSLKIQGAIAIAKEAVKSLKDVVFSYKGESREDLIGLLLDAKDKLFESRPTEPCMRNTLNFVLYNSSGSSFAEYRQAILMNIQKALSEISKANDTISEIGSHKIKDGMVVFTHCHSSTVVSILKKAKEQGKDFLVHNTETRPLFQGRKTAYELAKANIKVVHYTDNAGRLALKKADIVLFGCDALTSEGKVINKIGSELFAEVAHCFNIPVYACTHSWKFDPLTIFGFEEIIEERAAAEVWPDAPPNVTVQNYAFEIVRSELVSGVISELGVYPSTILVEELKKRNGWMFKR